MTKRFFGNATKIYNKDPDVNKNMPLGNIKKVVNYR